MQEPKFPKGTPEYDAYARELRDELVKFANGLDPYPYDPPSVDPDAPTDEQ